MGTEWIILAVGKGVMNVRGEEKDVVGALTGQVSARDAGLTLPSHSLHTSEL